MKRSLKAQLTIPADLCALRMAQAFAREAAALAKLSGDEGERLVLATEEAFTNAIEHAFEPGETGTIELGAEVSDAEFVLSLRDRGLPFDQSLVPEYRPPAGPDVEHASLSGVGLHLIRSVVDEVKWINHGVQGKELRLLKRLSRPDITEQLSGEELVPFPEDAPPAPDQKYLIRLFRPEDAMHVSRCAFRTYAYNYSREEIYYPERLIRLHETGAALSVVAFDEKGELAACLALHRTGSPEVAEAGQAMVVPAHRGRGLLEEMSVLLGKEVVLAGVKGISSEPVTTHVLSQKPLGRWGFSPCGVMLASLRPPRGPGRAPEQSGSERRSVLLYFRHLFPAEAALLHVPPHLRGVVDRISAGLGAPASFGDGGDTEAGGPGEIDVSFSRTKGTGKISVKRAGSGSAVEIRRAARDLTEFAGAEAIFLDLPLADPLCPELCRVAEEKGFFFSGIGPRFAAGRDILRLQRLNVDIDVTRLQVLSPQAREIVDFAVGEMRRVGSAR